MLSQRLLAAAVLIPLVIICLFFVPISMYVVIMLVVLMLAAWEWTQFLHFIEKKHKYYFVGTFILLIAIIYYLSVLTGDVEKVTKLILLLSVAWWLIALLLVVSYPTLVSIWGKSVIIRLLFALFTLVPFFMGMLQLRQVNYQGNQYQGAFLVLYVLVLVWATDSGAYFVGKLYGKHKLAPAVSPGKTLEGFLGGLFTSLIICICVNYSQFFDISFYNLFISSILAILASVLGDLTESMFKREAKIKDSGHLIPGHGGILDRIDSLTSAIPIFAAFTLYLI